MSQRQTSYILMSVFLVCLPALVSAEVVTISGQVLGPDGQPVGDCLVLVKYRNPDKSLVTAQAPSDAAGSFSFSFDVEDAAQPVTVSAFKEGLAVAWASVETGVNVTIKLGAQPVTCAGMVTDPEGNPIVGAEVWVRLVRPADSDEREERLWLGSESPLRDTTDPTGSFEIPNLPPEATVNIEAVAQGREFIILFDCIPADSRAIAIVLRPESVISGRITQEAKPVAAARVSCFARGAILGYGETMSAEDGTYRLHHLPPGIYDVIFFPPEELTARAIAGVELKPGDHFTEGDTEFISGGFVQGTVVAADTGRPVVGAPVSAYGPSRPEPCGRAEGTRTDEPGRYTLRLAPGRNKIFSWGMPGYLRSRVEPKEQWVQVREGETVTGVDLILHPMLKVQGQVLLPDGQPAAGVGVGAIGVRYPQILTGVPSLDFKYWLRSETDDQGYFELEFEQFSGPMWSLFAYDPEHGLAALVALEGNEVPDEPVEIRLTQGAYLLSNVVDTEGKPVANMQAMVFVQLGPVGHGVHGPRSNEQGRLIIGSLPPGVRLSVSPTGEAERFAIDTAWRDLGQIALAPGQQYELPRLVLNLHGHSLKVWVGDAQQKPVKGALVFAVETEEPMYVDEQGYCQLTRLPAQGQLWIVAAHPTEPLFAAVRTDPGWGFRANLILRPPGNVTGQVVDEQGRPASGARVNIQFSHDWRVMSFELLRRLPWQQWFYQAETDNEGRWSAEGVIGGADYRASVRAAAGDQWAHAEFNGQGGETIDLGEMVLKQ